jgi:ferric-dicitrate binding protein FerR (iron transport regulator)
MEPGFGDIPDQHAHDLLARCMNGDLTPVEAIEAGELATALLGRSDGFDILREVFIEECMLSALLARARAEQENDQPLSHVHRAHHVDVPLSAYRLRRNARASWKSQALRAAAILLIVTGIAAGSRARDVLRWIHQGSQAETRTVVTRAGQRDTVNLPDGSQAILAPGTELRYAIAPTAGVRELRLNGQAIFSVRHDSARPFRVRTPRAVIEDLGTTFAVREYSADAAVRVAVRTGAVTLHVIAAPRTSTVTLHQGESARVDSGGAVVRLAGSDSSDWAWSTGRLVFDNAPLPDVLAELHRWYDVDFQIEDSTLLNQHFTGAFEAATLSQVLDILGPIAHARLEQRGRVVIVTSRRGP